MGEARDLIHWKSPQRYKEYNDNPGPQHSYQKIDDKGFTLTKDPYRGSSAFESKVQNCAFLICSEKELNVMKRTKRIKDEKEEVQLPQ